LGDSARHDTRPTRSTTEKKKGVPSACRRSTEKSGGGLTILKARGPGWIVGSKAFTFEGLRTAKSERDKSPLKEVLDSASRRATDANTPTGIFQQGKLA